MAESAESAPELVGRRFGHWRLLRRLGEGAFGSVYEADNQAIRGRRAAVKVLHPRLAMDVAIKQRFLNEASAASRAEHENIIQVFDGGITDEGLCYAVMELLHGEPLGELLARGVLDETRTRNIGVQVANALGAAHAVGVVHRDLKPDNIFIASREANREFVKVLDFGVAKLHDLAPEDEEKTTFELTSAGMIIGTPGYMAPEQCAPQGDIDGRADIYALGLVLYKCVAGRLPFQASTQIEWLRAHLETPPPDVRRFAPVSPALAALIARMLAKRREERPQTMAEVAAALRGAPAAMLPEELPTLHADEATRLVGHATPGRRRDEASISIPPVAGRSGARRASQVTPGPKRRARKLAFAAILAVEVVLIGAGVVKLALPHDSAAGKVALLIDQADLELKQERWADAAATTEAALALAPHDDGIQARHRRAALEARARAAYQSFTAAVARGDLDAALVLHRSIPAGSLYLGRAAGPLDDARRGVIDRELAAAKEAKAARDCESVRRHAGAVVAIAANATAQRLLDACARKPR